MHHSRTAGPGPGPRAGRAGQEAVESPAPLRPDAAPGEGDGRRRDRLRGTLLGVVVGDAVGSPYEGHPGSVPLELVSRLEAAGAPLRYTDDTALTFALAESLLSLGRLDLDHVAATLASAYEREPDRGYGQAAAQLLSEVATGADWRTAAASLFGGEGSFGNGAAMRVAPIALHADGSVKVAARLGRASATVTHTHPEAVDAAGVQAAAVALALGDGTTNGGTGLIDELLAVAETPRLRVALNRIASLSPHSSPEEVAAVTGTGVAGIEAVPAAIAAASLHADSFAETIHFAIRMGGDTDTIAAMAGAIVGARLGEGAVADSWLERVEGVEHARQLGDRFAGYQGVLGSGVRPL